MTSEPKSNQSTTKLAFIDGLRGIAILMVMGVHTAIAAMGAGPYHFGVMPSLLGAGARGVQLFFMVSAFTLFLSWTERRGTESTPWANFYVRRAARILPMWWIACLIYAHVNGDQARETLATALFYFGFAQHALPSVIPGGWSIFAEEAFYFFLPVLALVLTTPARAGVFFAIALVAQNLWWKVAAAYGLPSANDAIFYMPLNHLFAFAAGVFLYQIWKKMPSGKMDGAQYDALAIASAYYFWTYNSEVLLGSIPLFFVFAGAMVGSPLFGTLTRLRIFRMAGKYCFSAYLFHFLIVNKAAQALGTSFAGSAAELRFAAFYPVVVAISLLISAAAFHLIEQPAINFGKRMIAKREATQIPVTSSAQ